MEQQACSECGPSRPCQGLSGRRPRVMPRSPHGMPLARLGCGPVSRARRPAGCRSEAGNRRRAFMSAFSCARRRGCRQEVEHGSRGRAGAQDGVRSVGQGSRRASSASRPLHAGVESGGSEAPARLERPRGVVPQHWGGEAVVNMASQGSWAVQRRDAADEARLEPCGGALIGSLIVNEGRVVRASQLIASVGRTNRGSGDGTAGLLRMRAVASLPGVGRA
jgi:hypothetical protein